MDVVAVAAGLSWLLSGHFADSTKVEIRLTGRERRGKRGEVRQTQIRWQYARVSTYGQRQWQCRIWQ